MSAFPAGVLPHGIAAELRKAGGRVTFARFMDLALTHPTEGYYSRTDQLLGVHGHFSTAPRLCPSFNRAVSRLLTELVDAAGDNGPVQVVELGGGEGDLARAVLAGWSSARPDLRDRVTYTIVEWGALLRARQQVALSEALNEGWRVSWSRSLPEVEPLPPVTVVLGNEFLDALPVHFVDVSCARPLEAWVVVGERAGTDDSGSRAACLVWDAPTPETLDELSLLFGADEELIRAATSDGVVEVRPGVGTFMRDLSTLMAEGCLVTIDYGEWFGGRDFEPGRCPCAAGPKYRRSARGYFRHQTTVDPLNLVGLQDLTADADFRALDLHGRQCGFETVFFVPVADLLRGNGAEAELKDLRYAADGSLEADREATILEALTDRENLGGAFKVMLQIIG